MAFRARRVVAGCAIALAGHVPATGLWLLGLYAFVFGASQEPGFALDCFVIVLQLVLLVGCVVPGVRLVRRGEPGFGAGLLIGWTAGILAFVNGTILIALWASLVSP